MELSADIFERTVSSLRGDAGKGAAERRNHPRVGIRCRLSIIMVEGGKAGATHEVWARDISRGGIGIVCHKKIAKGKRFVVRFRRTEDEPPLSVLCTVCNCLELAPDMYSIGAMFEGREIQALGLPPAQS